MGRVLLWLATISLLTAPLTQHFWSWDHFLHGGQDFETGMLGIVIILCLAVLLSQLCKQLVDSLFAACCALAFNLHLREPAATALIGAFFALRMERVAGSAIAIHRHPLKI